MGANCIPGSKVTAARACPYLSVASPFPPERLTAIPDDWQAGGRVIEAIGPWTHADIYSVVVYVCRIRRKDDVVQHT